MTSSRAGESCVLCAFGRLWLGWLGLARAAPGRRPTEPAAGSFTCILETTHESSHPDGAGRRDRSHAYWRPHMNPATLIDSHGPTCHIVDPPIPTSTHKLKTRTPPLYHKQHTAWRAAPSTRSTRAPRSPTPGATSGARTSSAAWARRAAGPASRCRWRSV